MLPMSNKVVHLHHKDEQAALERLNRITGLQLAGVAGAGAQRQRTVA